MPFVKNLVVPYHATGSASADGPAAVQMILEQIGASPPPSQAVIEAEITAGNVEPADWYSDPEGVKVALNNLKPPPPTFTNHFVIFSYPAEADGSRKITYTLHHYQVATATLVYSGGHWIVVKGVQTDVDPLASATYSIDGFWIHNPWPDDPVAGAPSQDVWISYAQWASTYFTSNVYGPTGGNWLNKYVSVCDPAEPRLGKLVPARIKPRAAGDHILSPDLGLEALREEVRARALLESPQFARAWERGRPGEPMLVRRLDRPDEFTYLFPWGSDDGIVAAIQLDARFGILNEAALFTRPAPFPYFGRKEILRRLEAGVLEVNPAGRSHEIKRKPFQMRLWPGTWCLQQALVWQPCWESRSPAFPFYVLAVGPRVFFISTLDGAVYDGLQPFGGRGRPRRGGA